MLVIMTFHVYWIQSGSKNYIGATVSPARRLRQHNGEITGGARRTRNKGPWSFFCVVTGFRTWREALQFEWAFKFYTKRCRCIISRQTALQTLINRDRWTSNAPPSCEVPLTVEYEPTQYGAPPEDYTTREQQHVEQHKTCEAGVRKRRWRNKLHGVA